MLLQQRVVKLSINITEHTQNTKEHKMIILPALTQLVGKWTIAMTRHAISCALVKQANQAIVFLSKIARVNKEPSDNKSCIDSCCLGDS